MARKNNPGIDREIFRSNLDLSVRGLHCNYANLVKFQEGDYDVNNVSVERGKEIGEELSAGIVLCMIVKYLCSHHNFDLEKLYPDVIYILEYYEDLYYIPSDMNNKKVKRRKKSNQ